MTAKASSSSDMASIRRRERSTSRVAIASSKELSSMKRAKSNEAKVMSTKTTTMTEPRRRFLMGGRRRGA